MVFAALQYSDHDLHGPEANFSIRRRYLKLRDFILLHVVINATELGRQRGGNETYLRGLIDGLAQVNPPIKMTLLICDWGRKLDLPPVFEVVDIGPYRRLPFLLWQQTSALRRLQADWYISTYFLPPILPAKGAVIVHDLSFRAYPQYYPRAVAGYMRWLTAIAIRQAKRVITVSHFSQQELLHYYPAAAGKTAIVPNGVERQYRLPNGKADTERADLILSRYGLERPYIFALGNIHPRKNLSRLLDAYLILKGRPQAPPAMVWGGLKRWDSHALLQRARDAGVVLPGYIDQADLPTVYAQAEMLIYPSLYEGFGLPPLEAMACGTPVIASNVTSLPEVVGDAALLVDPTSVEAISLAMARLLDEDGLRIALGQAGQQRAREFTWVGAAQQLLAAVGGGE